MGSGLEGGFCLDFGFSWDEKVIEGWEWLGGFDECFFHFPSD